ncbi:Replication factor C small subunit [Candidatus Norongarragalina meridionalis]|nr:Replication factor C small subunit [Candidatus Norongarragalina meridionalis]
MSDEFVPWVEKYRPHRLSEIIGHENVTKRLEVYAKKKNMPHLLFCGPAGCGKTTSVIALANELYGDQLRQSFLELNASDERGIDVVRGKIKDFARSLALSDVPFKMIFLDEADALTSDAQHALRRTMEQYSRNTRFCLSANYSSRIIEPLQSRCAVFRFASLHDEDLQKIIRHVAKAESLKVDEAAEKALLYVSAGDARKVINCLQACSTSGTHVTEDEVYKVASRARPKEVAEMVQLALKGKFTQARQLLDDLMIRYGMSGEDVIAQLYNEIIALDIPDEEKVLIVDRVGEYDFRLSEGADERIQLEALLAQIMLIKSRLK